MTGGVDWDRIKQRLAAVGEALTRDRGVDVEERRAMLEARTHALAQRSAAAPAGGLQVVEFLLGATVYAMEAQAVREVRPLTELTPLPGTPDFVSGVIHAHGRIVAVVDLRRLLALPSAGLADQDKVIILQRGDVGLGVLADRVVGTGTVAAGTLRAPRPDDGAMPARHLRGLTASGTRLLDVDGLLADPALVLDDEVAA